MKSRKYNTEVGAILIVLNFFWLYSALDRLFLWSGILYMFQYPSWILITESVCGTIGIILSLLSIMKKIKDKYLLLINGTLYILCMFIKIWTTF